MPFTNDDYLPSVEELTVPELNVTSCAMRTAARQMGKYCDEQCKEYLLCKIEEKDPRKCLNEGKAVTSCAQEFLGKVKKFCFAEFTQYMDCIDHSSEEMEYQHCKKPQKVYDSCIFEKLGQTNPEPGFFGYTRLHETSRPRPPKNEYKYIDNLPVEAVDVHDPEIQPKEKKYGPRTFTYIY